MELGWRCGIMGIADNVKWWTSTVVYMWDNRDGYGGGGDAGWQQKICGTTDMVKWVGRTATDW